MPVGGQGLVHQRRDEDRLCRWAQGGACGWRSLPEVFAKIQAQIWQVELVAGHDEGDLLLDQAFALVRRQGIGHEHNRLFSQSPHLVQPGPDVTQYLLFVGWGDRQNHGTPQQLKFDKLERIFQEIRQRTGLYPRFFLGRENAQHLVEVFAGGGDKRQV